ncbi:hypothetical protein QUF72_18855 [Desulfobacterales bacterium HSG2]|nr:hypothetical protein [Desulfobacterales bacterium HSG2]
MKKIAKNAYYELAYDEVKNRIYWTMKGYWRNMSVVPDFDKDWDTVQRMTRSGWTIFGDLSALRAMPDDVKNAQDERQKKLMRDGCTKVSCLVKSAVTKISLNVALADSGMDKILRYFDNAIEAERWLG